MVPYLNLGLTLVLAAGCFSAGWKVNNWKYNSERVVAEEASANALKITAEELAKLDIKYVTIRQKQDTIIHREPVYIDCKHTADSMLNINEALTGNKSSGDTELSKTDTTNR